MSKKQVWTAKYGFPYYHTIGHLWWKKEVPYGWEDRGEVGREELLLPKEEWYEEKIPKFGNNHQYGGYSITHRTKTVFDGCTACKKPLHIGIQEGVTFKFCLMCLRKFK